MSRLDLLLLAILLFLPNCFPGPIYGGDYYKGDEKDDSELEEFLDSDVPIINHTIPFDYDGGDYDDDEEDEYGESDIYPQTHHPLQQLVAPANITWDQPFMEPEETCPLTPKASARLRGDPERHFQKEIERPLEIRANFLAKEPDPPSTIDDLISGVCTDVIIIWARGTGSTGNVGSALGRCFFTYMKGNLDYTIMAQGVLPYAANIRGIFWGGSPRGARSMVMMVMLAVEQCPRSKIVLAGFSQGAQILRKAVKRIPASVTENIVAVVSFSDYKEGQLLNGVLKDRHLSFCIEGDWVCDGKNTIVTGSHRSLDYYDQLGPACDFIESKMVERGIPARAYLVRDGVEAEGESG